MIELDNLTDMQKSLCDILWELDDSAELNAFLAGLPERLRREAESLVQLMLLNSLDNTQDTKYADEMMSKILNKDNPSIH